MTTEELVRDVVRVLRTVSDAQAEQMLVSLVRQERASILRVIETHRDRNYNAERIANSRISGYAGDALRDIAEIVRERDQFDFIPA